MKRVFTKITSFKTFLFTVGIIFGIAITTCIGYGVNSIMSEGVSYTKSDGTTVSVKQALDDLINKSLTRVEFLENWLSINTGLSHEQIKNTNKLDYLADVVSVGDYVAYDAGSWTSTASKPTSHGQFGGYTKDQNKANNGSCGGNLKGWRVYSIDTSTKTVTLIHAGQPECYYHGEDAATSVTNLNNRATDQYLNRDYADSAHMMNKSEVDQNILRATGGNYWLATTYNTNYLWRVDSNVDIYGDFDNPFGVRPVVVLKPNILTTGKGTDKVGQTAWILVKP